MGLELIFFNEFRGANCHNILNYIRFVIETDLQNVALLCHELAQSRPVFAALKTAKADASVYTIYLIFRLDNSNFDDTRFLFK